MATGGEESDEEWRGVGAQCDRKLEDINLSYNLYVKTKDLCKVTYGTCSGPVLWDGGWGGGRGDINSRRNLYVKTEGLCMVTPIYHDDVD